MSGYSAHVDTFARDSLPPRDLWPEFLFELAELEYPERMNCGEVLLDRALTEGHAERRVVYGASEAWTWHELYERSNQIARVLTDDLEVVPGNRVLLRGTNAPMLVASWLAVMKAGAIAVTTMPMLRRKELATIARKARIDVALTEAAFSEELEGAARETGLLSRRLSYGWGELETHMTGKATEFENVVTASDDVCLLAFTSGTTGEPKATMHFHRDVLAMADTVARHVLETGPQDVYIGSPPLGFTFGLGALLVFPLRFRAATALVAAPSPDNLLGALEQRRATCLFTAPTAYRALLEHVDRFDVTSLRRCVSAGEPLPKATSDAWYEKTGIRIIDGIGSTEMMHIFISASGADIRPGSTGRPIPGYRACVLDEQGTSLPPGSTGRLAVKGPTGCRYLADERQRSYVCNGWNVTGDTYRVDEDGYFWFQSRADDLILSAGYNVSGPEVEWALLNHAAVHECAVVASPDPDRGTIVKAFVVLNEGQEGTDALRKELQDFVKASIAPYKYPRAMEFVASLPKTPTGKLQRYVLRRQEEERATARIG